MRYLLFLVPLLLAASPIEPRWHWDDAFSSEERNGLQTWVSHALSGLQRLVGTPEQTLHIHFRRSRPASEPVPWAHTWKGDAQRVYFHVDTTRPWTEFRADWTAPHELVHLLFPYLGEDGRWFAEGIASYLQYPIMYASDALTWDEAIRRYRGRFAAARRGSDTRSVLEQSRQDGRTNYVRLYWGGAAYFLRVDQRLSEQHGLRLHDVIREFISCCQRRWAVDAGDMIRLFDQISRSQVFSEVFSETVAKAGFPETELALEWLSRHPPLSQTDSAPQARASSTRRSNNRPQRSIN